MERCATGDLTVSRGMFSAAWRGRQLMTLRIWHGLSSWPPRDSISSCARSQKTAASGNMSKQTAGREPGRVMWRRVQGGKATASPSARLRGGRSSKHVSIYAQQYLPTSGEYVVRFFLLEGSKRGLTNMGMSCVSPKIASRTYCGIESC